MSRRLKAVVVGRSAIGKTSLIIRMVRRRFPSNYIPVICENFLCTVAHEGKDHELALWDTGGAEEYDRLRPLAYHKTSFFLLCFAVDDPESLEQIESHFLPEIQHYSPGVPIIIVGLRVDLRSDSQHQQRLLDRGVFPTTFTQGEHLAERVGVVRYMECSALTGHGVDAVFEAGVAAGVDYEKCWLARQKHMWWSKK